MRILLDTHAFLLAISDSMKLSSQARAFILAAVDVYVSSASIWECEAKIREGKLIANMNELISAISASGFIELPLLANHVAIAAQFEDWKTNPFDRMLLAQSICEPLKFLTHNSTLKKYTDLIILV